LLICTRWTDGDQQLILDAVILYSKLFTEPYPNAIMVFVGSKIILQLVEGQGEVQTIVGERGIRYKMLSTNSYF
jgi:hypothetical protein